jgi:hypothetical protein
MTSDDRWVRPAEGEDPRDGDVDRIAEGEAPDRNADRQVSHDQDVERDQGLSADQPGIDPSDREREIGSTGTE